MSLGDTLKRFTLADNFIVNALGNLVGIKNPNANGNDLRVDTMPAILAQSGVPVVMPSSGTANASGQITHTTALPYQPSGVVGVYLPAGVVTGGSQGSGAGVYLATYSSTTVCQLAGSGITTTAGAYTQTTGAANLVSVTLPGGAMGINGSLRTNHRVSVPNNANTKNASITIGGSAIALSGNTGCLSAELQGVLRNRGAQNLQSLNVTGMSGSTGLGSSTAANGQSAVDTAAPQPVVFTVTLAVATDYLILEGYTVEVLPGLQ